MTRKEAIRAALSCRGHIYTTDELWEDDENCILSDALGNLIYGNGELVEDESQLPLDGWWDATDIEENENEEDWSITKIQARQEDVLWDENDL